MLNLGKSQMTTDTQYKSKTRKPLTITIMGGGNRGKTYAEYALKYPDELKVLAIVEPNEINREYFTSLYQIPEHLSFADETSFFAQKKLSDAIFIATPDHCHYSQAINALNNGYHILLEKPIAQNLNECYDIAALAEKKNLLVGVCHVLRYSKCFQKVKQLIESKELGEIINIIHFEPVGLERMAHAFIRGQWRKQEDAGPIIITKSCHDLDLIQGLVGKKCKSIASYGALNYFKQENAPKGSTDRCINGCLVEESCPYSAVKIYLKERSWLRNFALTADEKINEEIIRKELKEGLYGRCVFHCDNTVIDSQVVSMLFEDNVTANFTMSAFTKKEFRTTRILLTNGEIFSDEKSITYSNFQEGTEKRIQINETSKHGGGDHVIIKSFINACRENSKELLPSNIDDSIEGFRMAIMAEESRIKKKMIEL
ncbi:Gfo/Idh/MocA family protein [Bacteroides sedimenti]|uniref:Oxidoreductase n=1 Tax=Bacteroides sedimenti TaxID=2136147 RepID=A0ABM8IGZ2_9BACE